MWCKHLKLRSLKIHALNNSTLISFFRFDELHYGKYVSLYLRNTFFFEKHPPFGKQLIAGVAHLAGYDGNYTFSKIGAEYTEVRKFY
jgi:dolichyl-phosphate-mannose--protein O-mannosyl transferase